MPAAAPLSRAGARGAGAAAVLLRGDRAGLQRALVGERLGAAGACPSACLVGEALAGVTVVGASGSSAGEVAPRQLPRPSLPKRPGSASQQLAEASSLPPPLPKMPPTREAVAITSVTFQSSGPAAGRSPRTRRASCCGFSRASAMYWLIAGDVVGRVLLERRPWRRRPPRRGRTGAGGRPRCRAPAAHCSASIARLPGAADEARQLGAAGVAQHVDEEQAVLGGDVAGAEHRAAAGGAIDVRHAEALVADDRDVAARASMVRSTSLGLDAERGVLEVLADVARPSARGRVDEVAVHRQLVVVVRRALPVARKAASCARCPGRSCRAAARRGTRRSRSSRRARRGSGGHGDRHGRCPPPMGSGTCAPAGATIDSSASAAAPAMRCPHDPLG